MMIKLKKDSWSSEQATEHHMVMTAATAAGH